MLIHFFCIHFMFGGSVFVDSMLLLPLFVGFLFGPCFVMQYLASFLVL